MFFIIFTAALIVGDFISGFIRACYLHEIDSTVLRRGLYHKFGEFMLMGLSFGAENAAKYTDFVLPLPLLNAVCAYISVMEIVSIFENILQITPELGGFLKPFINRLKNQKSEEENNNDTES